MSIVILPDAQADLFDLFDLLELQDYRLNRRTPELWTVAEDDICAQLTRVDAGLITGPAVSLLGNVGITDYKTVLTSHHRVLYRQVSGNTYVYAVAGQVQDFQALLLRRLFKR